jgi:hypothetical protein
MKKFIVVSLLAAVAGIGVGVTRRSGDSPTTTVSATAGDQSTATTTTAAPEARGGTGPTTAAPAKVAVKAPTTPTTAWPTTTTTAKRATTTTTAPVATTTTAGPATTTTTAGPSPACTITPNQSALSGSEPQALRLTSNLANTPVKIFAMYPADLSTMNKIPQQRVHQAVTDAGGADTWSFVGHPGNPGNVQVWVNFYPVGAKQVGSLCRTSFQAV